MQFKFEKATKEQAKLRMGIYGPSGGGKTWTALMIASALGGKVVALDTENGSAAKYADIFEFFSPKIESYHPKNLIEFFPAAHKEGFDVAVVDSLSAFWQGREGMLEQVDAATKRSQSHNSFKAWGEVAPLQNQLVEAIISAPMHVICTMRSKTEYVIEKDERTGRNAPRKIGLAPIQKDNFEYEMDIVGMMDPDNNLIIQKSRCPDINGKVFNKPGKEFAEIVKAWLSSGQPVKSPLEQFLSLISGFEQQANNYLISIQWISEGQGYADLPEGRIKTILQKPEGFMEKLKGGAK